MTIEVDDLIHTLITGRRQATHEEILQIIAQVGRRPIATYPVKMTFWLRREFEMKGVAVGE